jgi:hypothetical protein
MAWGAVLAKVPKCQARYAANTIHKEQKTPRARTTGPYETRWSSGRGIEFNAPPACQNLTIAYVFPAAATASKALVVL